MLAEASAVAAENAAERQLELQAFAASLPPCRARHALQRRSMLRQQCSMPTGVAVRATAMPPGPQLLASGRAGAVRVYAFETSRAGGEPPGISLGSGLGVQPWAAAHERRWQRAVQRSWGLDLF